MAKSHISCKAGEFHISCKASICLGSVPISIHNKAVIVPYVCSECDDTHIAIILKSSMGNHLTTLLRLNNRMVASLINLLHNPGADKAVEEAIKELEND